MRYMVDDGNDQEEFETLAEAEEHALKVEEERRLDAQSSGEWFDTTLEISIYQLLERHAIRPLDTTDENEAEMWDYVQTYPPRADQ